MCHADRTAATLARPTDLCRVGSERSGYAYAFAYVCMSPGGQTVWTDQLPSIYHDGCQFMWISTWWLSLKTARVRLTPDCWLLSARRHGWNTDSYPLRRKLPLRQSHIHRQHTVHLRERCIKLQLFHLLSQRLSPCGRTPWQSRLSFRIWRSRYLSLWNEDRAT